MLGLIMTDQESINKLWTNNPDYGPTQRIIRPLDNPSINTLPVLPVGNWTPPAIPGSRARSDLGQSLFQQIVDIVPNRVSLVAGGSLYSNETTSVANISIRPITSTIANRPRVFIVGV